VASISAGTLSTVALMGGSTLGQGSSSTTATVAVTARDSGQIELQVSPMSGGASQNALFSVTTNSSVPIKNCTVGVGPTEEGGLSTGAKAGIGIGATIAALGLLGGGGYFVSPLHIYIYILFPPTSHISRLLVLIHIALS
jgi:hypothetical protein